MQKKIKTLELSPINKFALFCLTSSSRYSLGGLIIKMKYTLLINQKSILDNKLDIDLIDACIIDFITSFSHSEKCRKMIEKGTIYYFIKWSIVVEQLPIIGIKTRKGIYDRLHKICEKEILKAHEMNGKGSYEMYFAFGEKHELLFFDSRVTEYGQDSIVVTEDKQESQSTYNREVTGEVTDGLQGGGNPSVTLYNNNNNIHNTINNNTNTISDQNFSNFDGSENKSIIVKKEQGVFHKVLDIYYKFHEEKTGVVKEINSKDGKKVKELIAFCEKNTKRKHGDVSQEQLDLETVNAVQWIFNNYDKWGNAYHKSLKLEMIVSNLIDIINNIKNGITNNNTNKPTVSNLERAVKDNDERIKALFGLKKN